MRLVDTEISDRLLELGDDIDRRIMKATRALVISQGIDATSMAAIARGARISRPTLYARYSNRVAVVRNLLNHEIVGLLDLAFPLPATSAELISAIVTLTERATHSDLLKAIIKHNPDALVTYQFQRLGRSQKALIRFLKNQIAKLQAAPSVSPQQRIRQDDPGEMALFILLTTQMFALQSAVIEAEVPRDTWIQELTRILEGYLYQCPSDTTPTPHSMPIAEKRNFRN